MNHHDIEALQLDSEIAAQVAVQKKATAEMAQLHARRSLLTPTVEQASAARSGLPWGWILLGLFVAFCIAVNTFVPNDYDHTHSHYSR